MLQPPITTGERLRCELKLKMDSLLSNCLNTEFYARLKMSRHLSACFNQVFDENKILFVHIPKNGGSSIATALSGDATLTHAHWRLVDYYADSPQKATTYHKFCVVRNPWDRVVSAYHYLSNQPASVHRRSVVFAATQVQSHSFPAFVDRLRDRPWLLRWPHLRSQWEYMVYRGINGMDSILRFENLDADFIQLVEKLKLRGVSPKHVNRSPRQSRYQDYYDERTKAIVSELYADDIKAFGYKFGD